MILIQSVVNSQDGQHAVVALDGAPAGPLTFWAYRTPDTSKAIQVPYSGTGPYTLAFSSSQLWYLYAKDNNGFTPAKPIFVGLVNDTDINEIGNQLKTILLSHQAGIESVLQQWNSATTIKQIIFGSEYDVTAWPAIVIGNPRSTPRYIATEFVRDIMFDFTIMCICAHNDEQTEIELGGKMGRIVQQILNLPDYESLVVGDISVGFGLCAGMGVRPVRAGDKFGTATTLSWSCRTSEGGRY